MPPPSYDDNGPGYDPADESLFYSDAEILSDDDIQWILETPFRLPESVRIAILHIGHRSLDRYGYSWYYRPPQERELSLSPKFIDRLRESERVYDASYLPTFLLPKEKSVGLVREAAARYQADLVLIFKTESRVYDRYKFLRGKEAKAYCTAECALLDVRTGIIPFTSRSMQDFIVNKESGEFEFSEAVARAEAAATDAAMLENAENLLRFIEQLED
jgi:hypothetical protein